MEGANGANGIQFGNALVKNRISGMKTEQRRKTKTIMFSNEENVKIKISCKNRSKKTSITNKKHSKSEKKCHSHIKVSADKDAKHPYTMKALPVGRPTHDTHNHVYSS